jgi:photosystem II stability/assembly factor-like uncharacterized protein
MLLAGARQGLLFQSVNGGKSWSPLSYPGQLRGTLSTLEIDPRNPAIFFAGVKDDRQSSGVYRTTDSGATWTLLLKGQAVWSLAIWPGDSRIMAAGTEQGVYLSADGRDNWRRISPDDNADLHSVVSLAFHPTDRQRLAFRANADLSMVGRRTGGAGRHWPVIQHADARTDRRSYCDRDRQRGLGLEDI